MHKDAATRSPDGTTIATACAWETANPGIQLWDAVSGNKLKYFPGKMFGYTCLAWSPNGKMIAAGTHQQCGLRFIDVETDAVSEGVLEFFGLPQSVAFSPDGRNVAIGTDLATVEIWSPQSKTRLASLPSHPGRIRGVAWSPKGEHLAVGADRSTAILEWPTARPQSVFEWHPWAFNWSPNGKHLAFHQSRGGGSQFRILGLNDVGPTLGSDLSNGGYPVWSADGNSFTTVGDRLWIWDSATQKVRTEHSIRANTVNQPFGVEPLAFSPTDKAIAVAVDDTVRLIEPDTGAEIRTFKGSQETPVWIGRIAFSFDGKLLAYATTEPGVGVWDTASGELLKYWKTGGRWLPDTLVWLHNATQLATGQDGRETLIWEPTSGKLLKTVPVDGAAFLPQGGVIAARGASLIHLHEEDKGRLLATLLLLRNGQTTLLAPDGQFSGTPGARDEFVYVVATENGQETFTPDEFSRRFGWTNDPANVRLSP
jgi:WD40 repeat protein